MRLIDADKLYPNCMTKKGTLAISQNQIANAQTVEMSQNEWIPVSERLPAYSGLYLISVDDVVTVASFTGTYFMHRGGGRVKAYAWQPLPEPYKKGGAE